MAGLLEVGRVAKSHGLSGEVVVDLWSELPERLAPGTVLRTEGDGGGGQLVVLASRPHQGRWLVQFEGVSDRSGADALRGTTLHAPPVEVPGTLWVHELIGAEVVAVGPAAGHGVGAVLGTVSDVEPNPASDLIVLEGGGLIPLRFVVSHEPGRRVVVDIPEGLLE